MTNLVNPPDDLERLLLWCGDRAREARLKPYPIDIRIEIDRGFFVITKEQGVIKNWHARQARELPALLEQAIREIERLRDDRARYLEGARS